MVSELELKSEMMATQIMETKAKVGAKIVSLLKIFLTNKIKVLNFSLILLDVTLNLRKKTLKLRKDF